MTAPEIPRCPWCGEPVEDDDANAIASKRNGFMLYWIHGPCVLPMSNWWLDKHGKPVVARGLVQQILEGLR